jgi:hypothetical protein
VVALRCGRTAGTVVAADRAPRSRGACIEGATTGCRIVSALVLGAGRAGGRDAAGGQVERAGATAAGMATGSMGAGSSAGGADRSRNPLAAVGEG